MDAEAVPIGQTTDDSHKLRFASSVCLPQQFSSMFAAEIFNAFFECFKLGSSIMVMPR